MFAFQVEILSKEIDVLKIKTIPNNDDISIEDIGISNRILNCSEISCPTLVDIPGRLGKPDRGEKQK